MHEEINFRINDAISNEAPHEDYNHEKLIKELLSASKQNKNIDHIL